MPHTEHEKTKVSNPSLSNLSNQKIVEVELRWGMFDLLAEYCLWFDNGLKRNFFFNTLTVAAILRKPGKKRQFVCFYKSEYGITRRLRSLAER